MKAKQGVKRKGSKMVQFITEKKTVSEVVEGFKANVNYFKLSNSTRWYNENELRFIK